MYYILIALLFTLVAPSNIIMIGDTRTAGIAIDVIGFPKTDDYTIKSKTPIYFKGHYFHVTASHWATVYNFTKGDLYQSMHEQISKASSGTYVFLCLGLFNIRNYVDTKNFYIQLAQTYRHVKFIAFPVVGVSKMFPKQYASNELIYQFNLQLNALINEASTHTSNLVFKNFLITPLMTALGDDLTNKLGEGYYYSPLTSSNILNLMLAHIGGLT